MEANLGFPLPLTVLPKGVTQVTVVYVKRVNAKTGVTAESKTYIYFCKSTKAKSNVILYFRVPQVRDD